MSVLPAQVNPPLGYGTDLSCVSDLTAAMTEVTGRTALAEALARRLQTPRGGLIDDPNYGYDVTGEIDDDLTTRDIARIASQVDAECAKDERVISTTTTAVFLSGALTLSIDIRDSAGPFKLVLLATSVSLSVLKVA